MNVETKLPQPQTLPNTTAVEAKCSTLETILSQFHPPPTLTTYLLKTSYSVFHVDVFKDITLPPKFCTRFFSPSS